MKAKLPKFCSQAYTARAHILALSELVNWYPEIGEGETKEQIYLVPCPGKIQVSDITSIGGNRGMYATSTDRLFTIIDGTLWELTVKGETALGAGNRGTLQTRNGVCSFADDGYHMMIVDGTYSYIYKLSVNTLTLLSVTNVENCSNVLFLDGYFITNNSDYPGQFFWNDVREGVGGMSTYPTWADTNFATAEASPDPLQAMAVVGNNLMLCGSKSIENWYDSGSTELGIFQPIQNANTDIGIAAPSSLATNGDVAFWLGGNSKGFGVVWMMAGLQSQKISTHAIEYILSKMTNMRDCIGYTYQQEGHAFYVMNFTVDSRTLVFDFTNQMWHERQSYNTTNNQNGRDLGQFQAFFNNKIYVGSYSDGKIYQLDLGTFTEAGAEITRLRTTPHMHYLRKRIFYHSFELDMQRGTALIPSS